MNPSQCLILVAPNGNCYCINKDIQQVAWSYLINDRNSTDIYVASREDGVKSYMDAIVNNDGQICLCHCTSDLPPNFIEWRSDEEVKSNMKLLFGDNVLVNSDNGTVDLHDENDASTTFRIHKTKYQLFALQWSLQYYKYEASFIQNDSNCVSSVPVYHTHDVGALEHLCSTMKIQDENLDSDIWIQKVTLKETLEIKDQLGANDNNLSRESFSQSCRTLWQSRDSNHIVKFYGAKADSDFYYHAFEYCPSTLHQFIVDQGSPRKLKGIMRGLIDGLKDLHGKNICHGNLNPWNILLTDSHITKISGFSNSKSLTTDLRGRDLRALGKLIIYCYSACSREQTDLSEEDYELEEWQPRQMFLLAYEAKDIASRLQQERSLPSLTEVCKHPWIWENEMRIDFIKDASEYLEASRFHDHNLKAIRTRIYENEDWSIKIPHKIVAKMKSYGEYDYDKPRDLLRFIRNLLTHLPDVLGSEEITSADCKFLGPDKFGVEKAFRLLFPALLIQVYAFLRDVPRKDRASLKWYFHG